MEATQRGGVQAQDIKKILVLGCLPRIDEDESECGGKENYEVPLPSGIYSGLGTCKHWAACDVMESLIARLTHFVWKYARRDERVWNDVKLRQVCNYKDLLCLKRQFSNAASEMRSLAAKAYIRELRAKGYQPITHESDLILEADIKEYYYRYLNSPNRDLQLFTNSFNCTYLFQEGRRKNGRFGRPKLRITPKGCQGLENQTKPGLSDQQRSDFCQILGDLEQSIANRTLPSGFDGCSYALSMQIHWLRDELNYSF